MYFIFNCKTRKITKNIIQDAQKRQERAKQPPDSPTSPFRPQISKKSRKSSSGSTKDVFIRLYDDALRRQKERSQ